MRAVRFGAALAVTLAVTAGPALADGGSTSAAASAPTATAATTPTPASTVAPSTGVTVARVTLSAGPVDGALHTYFAKILDADGNGVVGANPDIGALTDNPDLRPKTVDMYPTKDPTVYGATIEYPADGDWVITVRVSRPSEHVELFTDKVTGAGTPDAHALTPSRAAVLRDSPNFYKLYDPYGPLAQSGASLSSAAAAVAADGSAGGHGAVAATGSAASGHAAVSLHEGGLDPTATLLMVLHVVGAGAWLVAVLGLALANRMGPGQARNDLIAWISRHYTALAGGGLLVVVITGLNNVKDLSPGLTTPSQLVETGTGLAYLAVFAFKMALTAGSLATTWRIHQLLPSPERLAASSARPLLSVGAMADDAPSPRLLKLAEANATFGGLIVVSVTVLNQLHHVIH